MARQLLISGLLVIAAGAFLLPAAAQRCPGTFNVQFRQAQQTSRYYQEQQRLWQLQFQQQQTQRMQQMQQRTMPRTVTKTPPPITRTSTATQNKIPKGVVRQPNPVPPTAGQPKVIAKTTFRPPPIKKPEVKTIVRKETIVQPKRQWVLPETRTTAKTIKKVDRPTVTARATTIPPKSKTYTKTTTHLTVNFKCFQCHQEKHNTLLAKQPRPMPNPVLAQKPQNPILAPRNPPVAMLQPRLAIPLCPTPSPISTPLRITPVNPILLAATRSSLPAPMQRPGMDRPAPLMKVDVEKVARKDRATPEPAVMLPLASRPGLVLLDPIAGVPNESAEHLATEREKPGAREGKPRERRRDIDGPPLTPLPPTALVLNPSPWTNEVADDRVFSLSSGPGFTPLSSRPFLPLLSRAD